ncbi:hypothetical protein GCM10010330_03480 [Streptomyces tendae]|nr:hypothetical protein GCM10010330_03480 [Streptomyces tendae]
MPDPETSTTRRLARRSTGLAATVGAFLGKANHFVRSDLFVRSYECFASPDTGKSTKRPTVSNDTGTPDGPLGTGAWPEGSVCVEPVRERGLCVGRSPDVPTCSPLHQLTRSTSRPFIVAKGKTLS